ncbi:hypothetical protein LGL08_12515 [Clostridium estertheticum]|uniref:hypothetical protein n=1 Tax=Clostridium estertheticum TaxID=238834 RepID=UPI001CF2B6F3|nr:hypothetical protein [Clostridium estertheticum]MCB2306860.1 hypothetical protein [Clostridium estertheticum]MCB2345351.1 hypothetical protein [Clostridium estertheticum]MCB2350366.1 hypothetical protein [Clostridium estertheticum]WAG45236.1 hypothetical protein LL127_17095 [Clostridium estertheticum]
MSETLFNENGHVTKILIQRFKEGSLSDNELVLMSEHICLCETCAAVLADSFNNNELADAPLGFEQEVICKIKKKKESNTQFIFYSLRVITAASIALIFVFSNSLNFIANKPLDVNPINLSSINTISTSLNSFSQKIINMEVFNNEKGKK